MSEVEKRILKNQIEIMRALHYLLKKAAPDLVGRAGELDSFLDDLLISSVDTKNILRQRQ